ncbi:MAG: hypothetical protein AAGA60_15795 [Cyanobacteria bacterium P01_E01_bin.42]
MGIREKKTTMESKDLIEDLWRLSQYCDPDDLERLKGYGETRACSDSDSWIFQPGDPIRIGERKGIISELIADDMNQEARSRICVIFDGTYKEEVFLTNEPLTKENIDFANSFFVQVDSMNVVARRITDETSRKSLSLKDKRDILRSNFEKYRPSLVAQLNDWIEGVADEDQGIITVLPYYGHSLPYNLADLVIDVLITTAIAQKEAVELGALIE